MILLSKYRRGIGKAFLLVYFLFLGVNVFHFHHISLLTDHSYKNESPQKSNTDIILSGVTFCQLAEFSSSIFNLEYSADKQLNVKYFPVPALLTTNEVLVYKFYNLVNPLRGPPSFS